MNLVYYVSPEQIENEKEKRKIKEETERRRQRKIIMEHWKVYHHFLDSGSGIITGTVPSSVERQDYSRHTLRKGGCSLAPSWWSGMDRESFRPHRLCRTEQRWELGQCRASGQHR